jgi:hypothetical protein
MKALDRWREDCGFALILTAHLRKPYQYRSTMSIHEVFGSSAYVRGAEVVVGLRRGSDGRARLGFLKDREGGLPLGSQWKLTFDREHGYQRDATDGRPSTREQVDALRRSDPTLTQKQIATRLGVCDRTVRTYWRAAEPVGGDEDTSTS